MLIAEGIGVRLGDHIARDCSWPCRPRRSGGRVFFRSGGGRTEKVLGRRGRGTSRVLQEIVRSEWLVLVSVGRFWKGIVVRVCSALFGSIRFRLEAVGGQGLVPTALCVHVFLWCDGGLAKSRGEDRRESAGERRGEGRGGEAAGGDRGLGPASGRGASEQGLSTGHRNRGRVRGIEGD